MTETVFSIVVVSPERRIPAVFAPIALTSYPSTSPMVVISPVSAFNLIAGLRASPTDDKYTLPSLESTVNFLLAATNLPSLSTQNALLVPSTGVVLKVSETIVSNPSILVSC